LSAYQWRGVWGERQTSTLQTGKGYCANLGHQEDETGLVYMRARSYEPTTGRFVSEDPARDGVNWYLYAGNNPIKYVDPTGMFLDLLLTLLDEAEIRAKDGAAAQAVHSWGKDKIYQAVAKHSGIITGYLLATELGTLVGSYSKVGIYIKNTANGRQINIDFVDRYGHGGPHIDFQPDYIGGMKYAKLFIEGLVEGLTGGL
jgi:RHS repeat-associated protein